MFIISILAICRPLISQAIQSKSLTELSDEEGKIQILSSQKDKPNCFYMTSKEQCEAEYRNAFSTCFSYKDLLPSLKATQLTDVYLEFAGTTDQLYPIISGDLPLKIYIKSKCHIQIGDTQHTFFYINDTTIHAASQTLHCDTASFVLRNVKFVGIKNINLKILDSNLGSFANVEKVTCSENLKLVDLNSAIGEFPLFQPNTNDVIIDVQDVNPFNVINHYKDIISFSHSQAKFSLGMNPNQKMIIITSGPKLDLSSDIQTPEEAKINKDCCYIMLKKECVVQARSEHWHIPLRTNNRLLLNIAAPSFEISEIKQITSSNIEMSASVGSPAGVSIGSLTLLGGLCVLSPLIQVSVGELDAVHDEIISEIRVGADSMSTIAVGKLTHDIQKFQTKISFTFENADDKSLEKVMQKNWELFGVKDGAVNEINYNVSLLHWIHGFYGQLCYEIQKIDNKKLIWKWISKINDIPISFSTIEKENFIMVSRDVFIKMMSSNISGAKYLNFLVGDDYNEPISISGLTPTILKIYSEKNIQKINIIGTVKANSLELENVDVISSEELQIESSSLVLKQMISSNNAQIKITKSGALIDADLKTLNLLKDATKPILKFADRISHLIFTKDGLRISNNLHSFEMKQCEDLHQSIQFDPFNELYFNIEDAKTIPLTCIDLHPIEEIENAPFVVKGDDFNKIDYQGDLNIKRIKYIRYETDNTANVPPLKIPFYVQITNQKDDILKVNKAVAFDENNRFPYSFSESSPKSSLEFPEIKIGDRSMSTFEPKDIEIYSDIIKVNITEIPKAKLHPQKLLEIGPLHNCPPFETETKITIKMKYRKDGLPVIKYPQNGLKELILVLDDDKVNKLEYDNMFSHKQSVFDELPSKNECEEIISKSKVESNEPSYSSTSPSYSLALWCITTRSNRTTLYFGSRSEIPAPTQSMDPRPYFTSPPEDSFFKKLMKGVALFSFVGTVILTATACYFGGCIGTMYRERKAGTPSYNNEGVEDSMSSLSMVDGLNVDLMRSFKFIDTTVFPDVE